MPGVPPSLPASAKPPRLRTACNECHGAKVRCSGEKDGCLRCSTYNLKCEYQTSMVGRAPKRRRSGGNQHAAVFQPKVRHPMSSDAAIQPSQQLDVHQATSISTRLGSSSDAVDVSMAGWTPPAGPISGEMNATFQIPDASDPYLVSSVLDATSTNVATDHGIADDQTHHLDGDGDIPQPCLHLTCSENGCVPSIDCFSWSGLADEEALPLSTTAGRDAAFAQLAPLARSSRMVPTAYREMNTVARYPHAAMLMSIIDDLESCLQQTAPVDQVLNLNRTAMAKLPSIMEMEGFKACNSCPILATTVLDLVIGLYSMAISRAQAIPEEGGGLVTGSASLVDGLPLGPYSSQPVSQPALTDIGNVTTSATVEAPNAASQPTFAFGCLELGPEEQIILLNVVFERDLRKCIQTIQSYRRMMQKRWEASQDNVPGTARDFSIVSSSRAQDLWYGEIEKKAEELLQVLLARPNQPGGD